MISVIIPLYNKEKSIRATISSVLNQTFKKFEIIVVDDGSRDESLKVVQDINHSSIRIISQTNRGVSFARNYGISISKFDYIALLDADDLWEPVFLEEMINLIQACPQASLYGCNWTNIHENGDKSCYSYGMGNDFKGYVENYFDTSKYNTLFNSSSVVFKKADFYEIEGFDESLKLGEDIDLWFRFALNKKIAYLNKPLTQYLLATENRASKQKGNRKEALIGNLQKFNEFERTNIQFKVFLDTWRFHNIISLLDGKTNVNFDVNKTLRDMNLDRFGLFWKLMKFTPEFLQKPFYKLYNRRTSFKNL